MWPVLYNAVLVCLFKKLQEEVATVAFRLLLNAVATFKGLTAVVHINERGQGSHSDNKIKTRQHSSRIYVLPACQLYVFRWPPLDISGVWSSSEQV